MRREDRERIQVEVVSRVVERALAQARQSPEGYLETLVHDTLYHERRRLERDPSPLARQDQAFYERIHRRLRHASQRDLQQLLERICRHYAAEVVGNFDERVHRLATRLVPTGLWALLRAGSPTRLLEFGGRHRSLAEHLKLQGEIDTVRALADCGTLVVAPTHSSNLDSVVLGYGVHLAGLPPLTYGAGLNLFTNPMLSFFMRNLGAYRVDRRKQAPLYKEVLKEYATCSMEMSYHNLFFPGGTRARSGAVESHLKKGLLGAALQAFTHNLQAGRPRPRLFVVPCTLSYELVLEAETLIDDYLQEQGKGRYIIEDDESTRPKLVYDFFSKLLSLDSQIVLTFGKPMDLFGNLVDAQGRSFDLRGREVDPASYLCRAGEPVSDPLRDEEYTRELARRLVQAYRSDNVLMPTHVVAAASFRLLLRSNPGLDLFRLLRTGGEQASFPAASLHDEVERLLSELRGLAQPPRFSPLLLAGDVAAVVADALKHFGTYHTRPALRRRGDRIFHEHRNLLLYYGNRLQGYGLPGLPSAGAVAEEQP